MKSVIKNMCLVAFVCISMHAQAQTSASKIIDIKTSAICESCKKNIEKAVKKVDGVEAALLDTDTKVATVTYNAAVTSPEAIRAAINKAGYDADNSPANKDAYDHLDGCCKKE